MGNINRTNKKQIKKQTNKCNLRKRHFPEPKTTRNKFVRFLVK